LGLLLPATAKASQKRDLIEGNLTDRALLMRVMQEKEITAVTTLQPMPLVGSPAAFRHVLPKQCDGHL